MGRRQTEKPAARSAPLDGLRALAALSVLCFHVWLYGPGGAPNPREDLADKVLFELNLGLICFFVLSGFLLYRAFARAAIKGEGGIDLRAYAVRRAARIVPAYYVCIAGCLVLFLLAGSQEIIPPLDHLPLFAAFAQNYSPETVMQLNPVTWTLSIEAAMYVVLPLIGLVAYRLGRERVGLHAALLLALVAVTVAWNALVHVGDWKPIGPKVLPAYLGHFALGMFGALWLERRKPSAPLGAGRTAALAAAGAAVVILGAYWHEAEGRLSTTYVMFAGLPAALGFALVIVAAAGGRGPVVDWLSARPLAGIGLISYGVYLWHLPLMIAARDAGVLPDAFAARLLFVLALALSAGYASWRLVEKPMIRASRQPATEQHPLRVAPARA